MNSFKTYIILSMISMLAMAGCKDASVFPWLDTDTNTNNSKQKLFPLAVGNTWNYKKYSPSWQDFSDTVTLKIESQLKWNSLENNWNYSLNGNYTPDSQFNLITEKADTIIGFGVAKLIAPVADFEFEKISLPPSVGQIVYKYAFVDSLVMDTLFFVKSEVVNYEPVKYMNVIHDAYKIVTEFTTGTSKNVEKYFLQSKYFVPYIGLVKIEFSYWDIISKTYTIDSIYELIGYKLN